MTPAKAARTYGFRMPIPVVGLGAAIAATAITLTASFTAAGLASAPVSASPRQCATPFSPGIQRQLNHVVALLRDTYQVPGVEVAVDVPGEGCWTGASGFADTADHVPLSAGSVFPIASITKTFTATVILQLVKEGRLALSDPISRWVPYIQDAGQITITNLLNMTSGIYSEPDSAFEQRLQADPYMIVTPEQLIQAAVAHGPVGPPGGVSYSNTNYFILGLIAQDVTGQTIQQLITDRILRPLRLTSTSIPSSSAQLPASLVHGYQIAAGEVTDVTSQYAAFGPELGGAAGAMVSTLGDMERWAYALGTGELLTPCLQQQRLSFPAGPAVPFTPLPDTGVSTVLPGRYGLGIGSFGGLLGHNGGTTGYQADEFYLPSRNATVVLLINGTPAKSSSGAAGGLSDAAAISIAEIALGNSLPAAQPSDMVAAGGGL